MKAIHIKIYCNNCGKLLLHQRAELPDQPDLDNPLRQYVGLSIDPWCDGCFGEKMRRRET